MADMDLDDLDVPSQASSRGAGRFAPKGSKFQPKPKPKTEPAPSSSPPLPVPSKEELDSKPLLGLNSASDAKTEVPDLPPVENDGVAMDVDAKAAAEEENVGAVQKEGEEEDEVVREIDVYFTPSIDNDTKLYVFQYPLRPLWRPYEMDERCEEVRVKPESGEVEVDLALEVNSRNYDADADPRIRITKQTLSSSWRPPAQTGYAIGVLTGNKLHLNPVHAVVQLRPSLQHLKPGGSKKKNLGKNNIEDAVKSEELEEEKPVAILGRQGKVPGTMSEKDKDTEEWVPLKYHGLRSDISVRNLHKMMEEEISPIHFSMSPQDYVNTLCPRTSNDSVKSQGLSRRSLLSLPLEVRYKTWLVQNLLNRRLDLKDPWYEKHGICRKGPPVHRFDALKHLAPDESTEEILRVLQKHAQLVQGLWVPNSSLLFGKDHGIDVLARDNILLLFSKSLVISNKQLPQSPQQLANAMKDVLNVLAIERPSLNDWKFREPPDMTFIKLHPDIVEEQEKAWESLEKKLTEFFSARNRPGMKNTSKLNNPVNPATAKSFVKVASKTSNGSLPRKPMSEETREALPKALLTVLHHYKVCSFQQICHRLRDMAVSESNRPKGFAREAAVAAADGADAPPEELQAIINQVAINIHGVYVLRSSPDYPQYDDLRKIIIDLLIAEGPDAKLKKASIFEAAKLQLKRDISKEYQKVLQELCVSKGSAWVLKSGDGNPK